MCVDRKFLGIFIALTGVVLILLAKLVLPNSETIQYKAFLEGLENSTVKEVELTTNSDEVRGSYIDGDRFYVIFPNEHPYSYPEFLKLIRNHKVRVLLDYKEVK